MPYPVTNSPLVTRPTFDTHHHPDMPDYGNQFHQIVATVRYMHSKYGIDVTHFIDRPQTLAHTIDVNRARGTVTIDGQTMPWFIHEDGPTVEGTGRNEVPCVNLPIHCENVYLDNQPAAHLQTRNI